VDDRKQQRCFGMQVLEAASVWELDDGQWVFSSSRWWYRRYSSYLL